MAGINLIKSLKARAPLEAVPTNGKLKFDSKNNDSKSNYGKSNGDNSDNNNEWKYNYDNNDGDKNNSNNNNKRFVIIMIKSYD